jgi:hypothetical protein
MPDRKSSKGKKKRELPEALRTEEVKWPAFAVIGKRKINGKVKLFAAKFNEARRKEVEKACKTMEGKWSIYDSEKKAVMALPNGKVFPTGKMFCPFAGAEKVEAGGLNRPPGNTSQEKIDNAK